MPAHKLLATSPWGDKAETESKTLETLMVLSHGSDYLDYLFICFVYLIFGCAGSSLLCVGFLYLQWGGLL